MSDIIIQELDGDYEVHVPFKSKEGKRYKLVEIPTRVLSDNEIKLLNKLYGILWMDAYYDPESLEIQKYAKPLADLMSELNKTLHFKEQL